MARGDVVAEVATIANNGELAFDPVDTEWVLRTWSGERSGSVYLVATDETNDSTICTGADGNLLAGLTNIPVTASNYVIIQNASGSDKEVSYHGYVIK